MSSDSSEVDVIRTRITDYSEEDGTVLYAYQSKPSQLINVGNSLPGTSYGDQPKTIGDVLSHCRVIYDSIQDLDKKFNAISGKVYKLHRLHMKSMWESHRSFGFSYKIFAYPLSRRLSYQRAKKKHGRRGRYCPCPGLSEASSVEASSSTQGSLYPEQGSPPQQQNLRLHQDPLGLSPYAALSLPTYFLSQESAESQGTSLKPLILSTGLSSSLHASAEGPSLPGEEQQLSSLLKLTASPSLLEMESPSQSTGLSLSTLISDAASSVGSDQAILQGSFSDPTTWSVEEVIQFLKQSFTEDLRALAKLFREHDIDGEALLLLTSDLMMRYMGVKLGTALKVSGYIERLKETKYFKN